MIRNLALALTLFASLTALSQTSHAQLNYQLNLESSANRYVHVTLEFEAEEDETELMMAVWTPGSYLVREYARHLSLIHI